MLIRRGGVEPYPLPGLVVCRTAVRLGACGAGSLAEELVAEDLELTESKKSSDEVLLGLRVGLTSPPAGSRGGSDIADDDGVVGRRKRLYN